MRVDNRTRIAIIICTGLRGIVTLKIAQSLQDFLFLFDNRVPSILYLVVYVIDLYHRFAVRLVYLQFCV